MAAQHAHPFPLRRMLFGWLWCSRCRVVVPCGRPRQNPRKRPGRTLGVRSRKTRRRGRAFMCDRERSSGTWEFTSRSGRGRRRGPRTSACGATPQRPLKAAPMSAGLSATSMPASCSAAIFSAAVPLPPEIIAPACPMRFPGGAGSTGNERRHRLGDVLLDVRRRLFFSRAANLAHHQNRLRVGVGLNSCSKSINDVPTIGSPPSPTHVDWPSPRLLNCQTAS